MKNYLIPLLALLIVSCGDSRPKPTYDEMLHDVVLNLNVGTVGGDSVLKNFVKKAQAHRHQRLAGAGLSARP